MKLKKYPKHNINQNSGIYFALGLALVLLLTYIALEWKTYDKPDDWDISTIIDSEIWEEVPVTKYELEKQEKAKVVKTPEIEIVEDDEDIVETIIESTEADTDTEVISVESIETMDDEEEEVIPFIAIEEVPVFPGCENEDDKRACFQEMMMRHVKKNFRYPELAQEMELQGRVNIQFVILTDGSIGEVRMRGPHKILEDEAARIISKLPKMIPGKQRGKEVKVPFTLPIVFRLQ